MIVCKKCGFNNADADTFCGSCGAFLEWTGEKVVPPALAEPVPETPAAAEPARRGGFMALVQQVTAIGVPRKEAIEPPATIPGMPMPAPGAGPRPGMPGAPAPLGGAPGTPRPIGPSAAPVGPPRSVPPSSPPPSGPPRSAPPSGPPGSMAPTSAPPVGPPRSAPPSGPPGSMTPTSAPPSGPPRSAPPSGPPGSMGPTSAPPVGPPRSAPPTGPPPVAGPTGAPPGGPPPSIPAPSGLPPAGPPRSAPPIGPPPGAGGAFAAATAPASMPPAPVAPSLPRPSLPPPTLPAPTPMVIRVTPAGTTAPVAGVSPLAAMAAPAPAAPSVQPPGAQPAGVQPAPAQPVAVQPAALQPAAPRPHVAPKPAAAPPTKRLRPGDLICGSCGEGNDPVRKFCSRCGQSLATAVVASTPWYRRLLPHRKAKVLAAGERPKRRGGSGIHLGALVRWGRNVVLVVVLVAGIAYGAIPAFRDNVNSRVNSVIQNFTAKTAAPTPVHASTVTASSSTAGHAANLAVDAFSNTYWAATLSKDAHPKLSVGFSPAVNVNVLLFISGNTANELSGPRPKELHITFSNGVSQNVTLADEATSQQFNINGATKVTGVTIQIMSVYGSTSGNDVALSDVEFFGRQ